MHFKEDIEGIRYCLLMREGNQRFYTFEGFCDSLKEAKEEAYELMRSNTYHGKPNEEYWAFDTKKWKPYFPLYCTSNDQQFNVSLPIYYTNDEGRAELFKDYINRKVYGESINRQKRTRLHENEDTYKDNEYHDEFQQWLDHDYPNFTKEVEEYVDEGFTLETAIEIVCDYYGIYNDFGEIDDICNMFGVKRRTNYTPQDMLLAFDKRMLDVSNEYIDGYRDACKNIKKFYGIDLNV